MIKIAIKSERLLLPEEFLQICDNFDGAGGFNTDLHKIVDLPTDLHNAGDFRIFQMPYCGGLLPRVALRLTLGCEPLAPLGRSFFQNALLRGYLNTDFHK